MRTRRNKFPALKALFDSIDVDRSGTIDAAELNTVYRRTYPLARFTDVDITNLIAEADVNNDGVVSFDEFVNMMRVAEQKASDWKYLNKTVFSTTLRNLNDVKRLVKSASLTITKPLREMARKHSSLSTSFLIPSVAMRLVLEAENLLAFVVFTNVLSSYFFHSMLLVKAADSMPVLGFYSPYQLLWALETELRFYVLVFILTIQCLLYTCSSTWSCSFFGLSIVDAKTRGSAGFFTLLLFDASSFAYFALALFCLDTKIDSSFLGISDDVKFRLPFVIDKNEVHFDLLSYGAFDLLFFGIKTIELIVLLVSNKSLIEHALGLEMIWE